MNNSETFIPSNGEVVNLDSGNLFKYDPETIDHLKKVSKVLSQSGNISALTEVIKAVAYWGEVDIESQNFITSKDIRARLNLTSGALNKRVIRLHEIGLIELVKIERRSCHQLHPKAKCVVFKPIRDVIDIAEVLSEKRESWRKSAQKIAKTELTKSVLSELNLPPESVIKIESIPYGLGLKSSGHIEQVAAPKGHRKKTYVTTYTEQGKERFVITESMANVFTVEDIQTFCALITLSINQWANCIDWLKASQSYPENILYVEVIQLIKLLGKSKNEQAYVDIRSSMNRLIETIVKSQDGMSLFKDALGKSDDEDDAEEYTQDTFQFFDRNKVKLYSKERSTLSYNEKTGENILDFKAHGYSLVWNEDLYKRMLTEEFYFNVPTKILAAKPYVFLMYMMLRTNSYSREKFKKSGGLPNVIEYTVSQLHERIGHGVDFSSFKKSLMSELRFFDKEYKDVTSEIRVFKMEGIEVSAKHTNEAISAVTCVINQYEMLKACGIVSDVDGNVIGSKNIKAAPQSKSPISGVFDSIIKYKASMGDELPSELNRRLVKQRVKLKPRKANGKLYFKNPRSVGEIIFSAYSSDGEVLSYCGMLTDDSLESMEAFKMVKRLIEQLPLLSVQEREGKTNLLPEVFSEVLDELFKKRKVIAENAELQFVLENSTRLKSLLITGWSDHTIRESLLENIDEQIRSSRLMLTSGNIDMFSEEAQSNG